MMQTVMFLDISGFTAWSSERQPSQVFQLLESIYQAFDDIAKKMNVFKVETIGDSYVCTSAMMFTAQHFCLSLLKRRWPDLVVSLCFPILGCRLWTTDSPR